MEIIDTFATLVSNVMFAKSALIQSDGEFFGQYFEIIDFFLHAINSTTLSRDANGKDNGNTNNKNYILCTLKH